MNLNLMIDTSNFKPFDIGPALLILHDYRDAYYKYRDDMDKIAEEDGQYILPDDPKYKKYKDIMDLYNADRNAAMEDFNNGMNLRNQRVLNDIRRRHFNEIVPINKAIEAYNKDIDKITALGPNVTIAHRDDRDISSYYGGINPGIEYRDNKTILATAAGVVQGLDNALMSAPEVAGSIASQYLVLRLRGYNGLDALTSILKSTPESLRNTQSDAEITLLTKALENVYNQFAFKDGTPENKKIWEQVVTGAIQGILAPKYQLLSDRSYRTAHEKVMEGLAEQLAIANLENDGYYKDENGWLYDSEQHQIRTENAARRSSSTGNGAPVYNPDEWSYLSNFGGQTYVISYDGDPLFEDEDDYDPNDYTVMRLGSNGRLYEVKTAEKTKALKSKQRITESDSSDFWETPKGVIKDIEQRVRSLSPGTPSSNTPQPGSAGTWGGENSSKVRTIKVKQ